MTRSSRNRIRRGPLLTVAASACLVLMTLFVKQAREVLSGPEVVLWRGLLSLPLLMTRAYALDRASVVAGATYTGTLWALLGDVAVYGSWPGINALIGGSLVFVSSLWLVLRPRPPELEPLPREPAHHDA